MRPVKIQPRGVGDPQRVPLTHHKSAHLYLSGSKIIKLAWDTLPNETCAVIIAAIAAPDLSAAFLGKERVYTAGEAIVWAAALGSECAARAALVARPLTLPGGVGSAICRIVKSSKAKVTFDDVSATKFLMHPL